MPAIVHDGMSRPKAEPTVPFSPNVNYTLSVVDSTEESIKVAATVSENPGTFAVAGTLTTGSAVVTGATGAFTAVRPGFAVTGTGIPGGTTVLAATGDEVTLSANATATGSQTLTFDPPAVNTTAFVLKLRVVKIGSSVRYDMQLYDYDGTLGNQEATEANATTVSTVGTFSKNYDRLYNNLSIVAE